MISERVIDPIRGDHPDATDRSGPCGLTCPESTTLHPGPLLSRGGEGRTRPASHADEAAGPAVRKRVLVVDDSVGTAESLAMIVGLWGHECRVAYNGLEAIDVAREYRPEVVLLDLGLPGLDGFSVAQRFREDPQLRDTSLLAMTGYREDGDSQFACELGIERIFVKPLNLAELEAELSRSVSPRPAGG
jgi:CheY-like chemotaxis protein